MTTEAQSMTRRELAGFFGINQLLTFEWDSQGMPAVVYGDDREPQLGEKPRALPRLPMDQNIPRHQVAELLACHVDSVTRMLRGGLAASVVRWGGRSKSMTFSNLLVHRFLFASQCSCSACKLALEDAKVTSLHLLHVRHGAFESCGPDCGHVAGQICVPCDGSGLRSR